MSNERFAGIEGSDRPVVGVSDVKPLPAVQFRGVLLKPLGQQHDVDGRHIDPAGVKFDPDERYPIWRNFSYNVPDDLLGYATIRRAEDGGLEVDGELSGPDAPFFWGRDAQPRVAIGVRVLPESGNLTQTELVAISLTRDHVDPTQPPIQIVEAPAP